MRTHAFMLSTES